MAKAYFNRNSPLYIDSQPSFDGVEVEMDELVVQNVRDLNDLFANMITKVMEASAPEESAQELADYFAEELRKIVKTRKQKPKEAA